MKYRKLNKFERWMQRARIWLDEFADEKLMLGVFVFICAATFWLMRIGVIK